MIKQDAGIITVITELTTIMTVIKYFPLER